MQVDDRGERHALSRVPAAAAGAGGTMAPARAAEEIGMTTDIAVGLVNQPGTLLRASDALGRAGINIDGACGYVCDGQGVFHVLVEDAQRARSALIDAGLEIHAEQRVVAIPVENRPGSAAAILRRIAAAGINVDLLYVTADSRLVLGGEDLPALRTALG